MYKKAYELIRKSNRIALVSHVNPDGDALGSSLGMYAALKRLGKRVDAVNTTGELPKNLDFLPYYGKIKKELPKDIDLIVAFDSGSFDRLGIERPQNCALINMDHHISNTRYGDINLIEPEFASTSEVVYRFFKENGLYVDASTALCIYTALVTDTGFFRYERVQERVFLLAAELVGLGVNPDYVSKMVCERESLAKMRLLGLMLSTLELYLDGRVAKMVLTQEMLRKTGAKKSDSEEAANMARSLATVEVGVLLREEEDGSIKASLRSKDFVDVSKIAMGFGGGGHHRAAGFTVESKDFDEVMTMLLAKLKGEFGYEKI